MGTSKRELVLNCLEGKKHDRVPGSFWHHFPEDKWFSDAAVEAHLSFYRDAELDFIKIMEEIRYAFDIKSAKDWSRYIPPRRDAPERKAQLEIIKRVCGELSNECLVYTTIFNPLRTAGIIVGYDAIEAHISEDEKAISGAFSAMAESIAEYAADCISAGANGIFFSTKGAEKGRFEAGILERIVLSPDGYICRAISERSPYNILHICGFDTELSHYTEFPAAAVNWDCHSGEYDLITGAKAFPDRVILGGMQNHDGVLIDGTDEEISSAVKEIVSGFGSADRLIIGANCTLSEDVDYSRLRTAMRSLPALDE